MPNVNGMNMDANMGKMSWNVNAREKCGYECEIEVAPFIKGTRDCNGRDYVYNNTLYPLIQT